MQTCKHISKLPRTVLKQVAFKPIANQTRTMAFFPRSFYGTEQGFTPLFRLLDDFDNYNRQQSGHRHHRGHIPTFQPKFDVRETEKEYELHGELAGMNKEDVEIQFTDPQTMLIRGRIERSYQAGTPPAGLVEDTAMSGAITEQGEEQKKPHKATVEDEDAGASTTTQDTPASTEDTEVVKTEKQKLKDNAKYWVSERSVGEFSRSFNFPGNIDQGAVKASFKDGILSIIVPKAKKPEARRIAIN